MQQPSISTKETELNTFIGSLKSICSKPYNNHRDYAAAISEVTQKGAIPVSLLELCSAVKNLSVIQADAALAHGPMIPRLPETFVRIVSELSGVLPLPQLEESSDCPLVSPIHRPASNGATTEASSIANDNTIAAGGNYHQPVYRGFVDGV